MKTQKNRWLTGLICLCFLLTAAACAAKPEGQDLTDFAQRPAESAGIPVQPVEPAEPTPADMPETEQASTVRTSDGKTQHLEYVSFPLPCGLMIASAHCVAGERLLYGGLDESGARLVWTDLNGGEGEIALPEGTEYVYALCETEDGFCALCGTLPRIYQDENGNDTGKGDDAEGLLEFVSYGTDDQVASRVPLEQIYNTWMDVFRWMQPTEDGFAVCSDKFFLHISSSGEELGRVETASKYNFWNVVFIDGEFIVLNAIFPFFRHGQIPELLIVDPSDWKVKERISLPDSDIYGMGLDEDGHILLNDCTNVIGKVFTFDPETKTTEEQFRWHDLPSVLDGMTVAKWGGDYLFYSQFDRKIEMLRWLDGAQPERKTLQLAAACNMTSEFTGMIREFNLSQQEYAVQTTVYRRVTDDDSLSLENLHTRLSASDAPDILYMIPFVYPEESATFLERPELTLRELTPMLEADEAYAADSFFPGLMQALSSRGLYTVPVGVAIETFAAPARYAQHAGITPEEFAQMRKAAGEDLPPFESWMDAENLLRVTLPFYLDTFVDWQAKTASFDSEACAEWLSWCRDCSGDGSIPQEPEPSLLRYVQLATCEFAVTMKGSMEDYFNEPDYCYIGVPTRTGNGSVWDLGMCLSIPAQANDPEGAWTFIRFCLSYYEQQDRTNFLPATVAGVDHQIAAIESGNASNEMGEEVRIDPEDVEKLRELLTQTTVLAGQNPSLEQIIRDEADAYFAGSCTAAEAAARIQSRAMLYLMERG